MKTAINRWMLAILMALSGLVLGGCNGPTSSKEQVGVYAMTGDLADCKAYFLHSDTSAPDLTVVRCPNSSTTTQYRVSHGKTSTDYNNVVIDGVTYFPQPASGPQLKMELEP